MIVISGLDAPDDIARAITLGAVDFLPKTVNSVILRARIDTCLLAARQRASDQQTLEDLTRITEAAEALDTDARNPRDLDIVDLADRDGALGTLARVLLNKSIMVYNRRQAQAQQIKTLVGVLLLLLIGVSFGLKPALASLAISGLGDPLGTGFLTIGITALLLTAYSLIHGKGRWSAIKQLPIIFVMAVLAPVLPQILLLWVAGQIDSVTIAILLSLETLFVFAMAAGLGTEHPTLRRLAGLLIGLIGVSVILGPALSMGDGVGWLVMAVLMPISYALRTLLVGSVRVRLADPAPLAATIYGVAGGILFVAVALTDRLPDLPGYFGEAGLQILIFAIVEAIGAIAMIGLLLVAKRPSQAKLFSPPQRQNFPTVSLPTQK